MGQIYDRKRQAEGSIAILKAGAILPKYDPDTMLGKWPICHLLARVQSSLTVMSGLRFVRHAARQGKAVVIINRGQTRGDDLATIKLDNKFGFKANKIHDIYADRLLATKFESEKAPVP